MPKIGNKSASKTRHLLPSGFKKMIIRNETDIELLLMNNRRFCGEIAASVSAKRR
jgi:large subunit ribosomal protein L32e